MATQGLCGACVPHRGVPNERGEWVTRDSISLLKRRRLWCDPAAGRPMAPRRRQRSAAALVIGGGSREASAAGAGVKRYVDRADDPQPIAARRSTLIATGAPATCWPQPAEQQRKSSRQPFTGTESPPAASHAGQLREIEAPRVLNGSVTARQ